MASKEVCEGAIAGGEKFKAVVWAGAVERGRGQRRGHSKGKIKRISVQTGLDGWRIFFLNQDYCR